MKELFYIGQEGNAAPVDSLLAIIGPEGTDISGIDNYKARFRRIYRAERSQCQKEEEVVAQYSRSGN
jgi:pyruvate dehydrogenase E2 component (dihydrolipoamide acetyltransferase)